MAKVCEFCEGTGFVTNIEYNSDVHAFVPNGLIECQHPGIADEEDYWNRLRDEQHEL